MSGIQGNTGSLRKFSAGLRSFGRGMAHAVAKRAAPAITAEARKTYEAGTDPYGTPWEPSVDGKTVHLKDTGAMFALLQYVPIGEKLRVALTTKYAKYQIGKRQVFPTQDGPLPASYQAALSSASEETFAAQYRAMSEGT
jgi:hypothetical protein